MSRVFAGPRKINIVLSHFLYFWTGGSVCMSMVMWTELKMKGVPDEVSDLTRVRPLLVALTATFSILLWPGFIAFNVWWTLDQRKLEAAPGVSLDPEMFDPFAPVPGGCYVCGHERVRHVEGYGCNECRTVRCPQFFEHVEVPKDEWGPFVLCECGSPGALRKKDEKCSHVV